MKLYEIFFQYGEHENESELFASETGDTADARKYLLMTYGGDDGYMIDAQEQPELLKIDSVHPFTTVHASNGDPYKVGLL